MPLPFAAAGMGLMNILRAGRLAQGARAAYTASKGLAGRALGSPGAGLGSGTSGTGLQGLMARGAKRFPGASGSAEAGTGLLLGGEGVGDIMEGYQEGDIGQMAMGLGSLALGTPLASKGLRLAGSQRTLKSKFPQTAEAMRTTGKEFSARIPKRTTAVGLGGVGTGLVLGDEPPVSEQEPQVISQNPVDLVIKAIEYDKANPGEAKEKLGFDVNSPQYKKLAKEQLTKAYQDAEKMNIKPAQTFDEVVSTFTFNPKDTGGAVITNQAVMPNVKDPENGNLSPAEVNALANKQLKQSEGGAKLKEEITKNASDLEAEQFNRFYDKITNLTGGNDQTNNLILFKLATGLMKGKTGQSGIRGFLDVLGQAGSDTTDVAMALFQKEADRRKDLAVSYLKAKEKSGQGIKVEKDRRRIVVRDPNLPWGARTIDVARDKDTGLDAMIIEDPTTGGTKAVPMKYTEYTEVKPADARLDKRRKQLDSIETGYELATQVLQLPPGTFGAGGRIRLGVENVLGSIESIANAVGIRDIGMVDSPIDGTIINDYIGGKKISESGDREIEPTEKERKETAELQAQYRKEIGLITNSIRPGDKDLDNIVKAKLIEVRMKYILANALKDEDRLTRADIDDAAQATQILGLTSSDKVVKNAYKQLSINLQKNFDRVARSYIEAGGNEDFLMGYQSMPKVASILKQRQNTQIKQNIQQQQMNVLGTIK